MFSFRIISPRIALIAATSALLLSFSACTHSGDDGKITVLYDHLRDEVKSLDPPNAYDEMSLNVMPNILESLYQYSYLSDTVKVVPLVAADMPRYSKDRLSLTIPIKKGVRFADDKCFPDGKGREIKAQDFVYSFKRHALPSLQSQGWWIFDGKVVGINAFHDKLTKADSKDIEKLFEEPIEGLKALDDYTLQIKLIKPYPELMYILSMGFTAGVAREAIKAYADDKGNVTDHPVGTGPYVLKRWDRNHQIVLDRNPNYHPEFYPTEASPIYKDKGYLADAGKQLPFNDRIVFNVVKETQPAWLSFMKGTFDSIIVRKDNFPEVIVGKTELTPKMKQMGIKLTIESGVTFYYISFNMKDKLIGGSKQLRQALSSSLDRDKWIELFTNNTGQKMVTALPPGTPDRYKAATLKYDFNLAKAKELLKKAGYPNGEGLAMINLDMRGADSLSRQIAEFVTRSWSEIGVKVNVIYNTFPAYLEKAKQGNLQVSYGAWNMDYPDGENVYQMLYGPNSAPGPNEANYNNPEMNKLYEKMAIMESGPAREALVKQMDAIMQDDVPWAMGYYYAQYDVAQPWVFNYRTDSIAQNRYKYIRVNKGLRKQMQSGGGAAKH